MGGQRKPGQCFADRPGRLTCVAVVCRVVEHHVPPLGGDGGGTFQWNSYAPMADSVLAAAPSANSRTARVRGLNAVFIEKQEVDGVVHIDAEVVNVAWRQQLEVNDHAYAGRWPAMEER